MMFQATTTLDVATADVKLIFRTRHHIINPLDDPKKDDFVIHTAQQAKDILGTVTLSLTIFLTMIAAISLVVGGIGIGMAVVPLTLSAIAGVGFDQIGPVSAIALMAQSLGGPLVLAVIQAVITSRTLYLGGTTGPVKFMNDAQLHALDQGYTYGLLWVAGAAVIVGVAALLIGYTPEQVAHAQEVKEAIDAGEL
jgi:hypothetical protein